MMHDENTAMERSYHPTGAELWFLLSLLDDRPAPLFWPMGEPAENWPLVAVRLLDAGLAVRGENGLTPAAPLAPLLDTGCGGKVRRQTPDGVTPAPDGPDIRAALAATLTGEDAPC